ncbi:hypothetical protein HNQ57_003174 [Zhongshania antarctica]|uniref:Uncharacterized protein n=1 Tax=Zhongshania antarctica TaxID=641702 RepID=A0A840R7M1_9GAMM|nr:hypothetical protein [Zhongshania antarctica]MBB5188877.1 hypothetical protein [Zhongshania antarctica]
MLMPLLRSGVLYVIWRRHIRQRALGIIVTVLAILAVNLIHTEAFAFFKATERLELAPLAFYFRWLGWLLAGIGYLWFVERKIAKASKADRVQKNGAGKSPRQENKAAKNTLIEQHDGFDALRNNTPLRSRSEIMLERKKRDKSEGA